MSQSSAVRKDAPPAHAPAHGKRAALKSPWQRNSVRRRWAYLAFGLILVFVGILVFSNLGDLRRVNLQLLLAVLGFGSLPLLYPLAKSLGASRATAIWAMALLGACVPWQLLLRTGTIGAAIPFFMLLSVWCYTRVLARLSWSGPVLGLALVALFLANPWAGIGLSFGLGLHAAGWARQPGQWRALGLASGILALGALALFIFPALRDPAWAPAQSGTAFTRFLGYLLAMNAWVLPLLALPLLWLALFADPAHRWRIHAEAALPALIILSVLLISSFSPAPMRLRIVLGLAPLAALWLAMGLARLQARTPAWVWVPVGMMLVVTALPQTLMRWGCQAVGLHRVVPDHTIAARLAPRTDMLVPLYPYISADQCAENVPIEDI